MEREQATQRADLPHAFEGEQDEELCRVCGQNRPHTLHRLTPEQAAQMVKPIPREKGS